MIFVKLCIFGTLKESVRNSYHLLKLVWLFTSSLLVCTSKMDH